jgi:hypothetical protein
MGEIYGGEERGTARVLWLPRAILGGCILCVGFRLQSRYVWEQLLAHHARTGRFARVRRGLYRLSDYPAGEHEEIRAACRDARHPASLPVRQSATAARPPPSFSARSRKPKPHEVRHAALGAQGREDTPELREQISQALKDEVAGALD